MSGWEAAGGDRLSFSDDGGGRPRGSAAPALLAIGKSSKKLGENAGFRGIGRLAGIAYCDVLVFETSHADEDVRTRVEFDCVKLRHNLDQTKPGRTKELEAVMRDSCAVRQCEESEDKHFFSIINALVVRVMNF